MVPMRTYLLTEFGELCRNGRARMGTMTRPEMAKLLGLTAKTVNDIEIGRKYPTEDYVKAVTGLLALDPILVDKSLSRSKEQTYPNNVIPFRLR